MDVDLQDDPAEIPKFLKADLPFQSLWLVGGFGILTGILLSDIGLLGELIIALRNE